MATFQTHEPEESRELLIGGGRSSHCDVFQLPSANVVWEGPSKGDTISADGVIIPEHMPEGNSLGDSGTWGLKTG